MEYAKEVKHLGIITKVILYNADGVAISSAEARRNSRDADNPEFAEALAELRARQALETAELYKEYGM